jgi:hypothetical protein
MGLMTASKLYKSADTAARVNGAAWYPETRAWCVRVAERYGVDIDTAAAVVAVLSQRKRWRDNKLETIRALRGHEPRCLKQVARKVARLLNGERPEHVVSGDKITSFWRAICGDENAVVIDIWMLRAYGEKRKALSPMQYKKLAGQVRRDATRARTTAARFQATVWVAIRGAHN